MEISKLVTELYEYNVNEHTESKNGLTYLSWAWAWITALKHDPEAVYEVQIFDNKPYVFDENLGYIVFTSVTMAGNTKHMQLPVMDNKNKAQKHVEYKYTTKTGEQTVQPATMFDINTSIMRCLAKNLAMFGLGAYIYAGEDLPESYEEKETITDEEKQIKKEKAKTSFKEQAINNIRR